MKEKIFEMNVCYPQLNDQSRRLRKIARKLLITKENSEKFFDDLEKGMAAKGYIVKRVNRIGDNDAATYKDYHEVMAEIK